nr:thioredoxin family protein [Alcanivorax hongdengensis]
MGYVKTYQPETLTREQLDALPGLRVVEFGTNWCGYCLAAQPDIARAFELAGADALAHLKVEDGPGRPLGRSFRVKLWPTLIFMREGQELARLVRPGNADVIAEQLSLLLD